MVCENIFTAPPCPKSRRASKLHYWFKSYGNFDEWSGFCPLVELHREGSAPAACAAGLFLPFEPFFFVLLRKWFRYFPWISKTIYLKHDTCHVTHDMWHMILTHDMWHMILPHDRWQVTCREHSLKISAL